MSINELRELLVFEFGGSNITVENPNFAQPQLLIETSIIDKVCLELQKNSTTYFDFLSCITAVDNGPKVNTMEVIYHLYSIPSELNVTLKIRIPRSQNEDLPEVPSVSNVFKTAIWHEREIFDLFGIWFINHPDLRRIFLPVDWEGYPLRKDYQQQSYYRGIKVEY